jgi:predicted anti-sigma-YlaC factor YlaD
MLSCQKAAQLIEKKLETSLSRTEKMQLSMHTKMCQACSNYQSQQGLIDQALKEDCKSSSNEAECEDLKTSILKQLRSEGEK